MAVAQTDRMRIPKLAADVDLSTAVRLTLAREIALRFPAGAEREDDNRAPPPFGLPVEASSQTEDLPIDAAPDRVTMR